LTVLVVDIVSFIRMADKTESVSKDQAVTEEKKDETKPASEALADSPAIPTSTPTSPPVQPTPTTTPTPPPTPEETPSEETEEDNEVPLEKRNTKLYIIGIVLSILVMGATAGLFYFRSKQAEKEAESVETGVEEVVEPTATPTPSSLSREEISLEILNGSGVAGAAAEVASIFELLGYEIIEIGNADETEGNQLYVDSDLEDLLDQLLEDVEEELDISSVSGKLTGSTASARIILGE